MSPCSDRLHAGSCTEMPQYYTGTGKQISGNTWTDACKFPQIPAKSWTMGEARHTADAMHKATTELWPQGQMWSGGCPSDVQFAASQAAFSVDALEIQITQNWVLSEAEFIREPAFALGTEIGLWLQPIDPAELTWAFFFFFCPVSFKTGQSMCGESEVGCQSV